MRSRHAARATVGIAAVALFSCNPMHRDRAIRSDVVKCTDLDDGPWGCGGGSDELDAGSDVDAGSNADASDDASDPYDASPDSTDSGSDSGTDDGGGGGSDSGTGSDGGGGGSDAGGPTDGGTDAPVDAPADAPGDGGCPVPAGTTFTDTVTVDGKSAGTAAAGTYTRSGSTLTTSAVALRNAQTHAADYDGPTKFTATYTIVLDDKGALDKSKSSIKFKTVNYTASGRLQPSTFTTKSIDITDVTLTTDCVPKLKSFKFSSSDWYPDDGEGSNKIMNRTLSGQMDVTTGKTSYVAKYADKTNGAVYTYNVSDTKPPVAPPRVFGPPPVGDIFAPPDPDYELAGPGTFCDSTIECDFPDGLSCIAGYCD